MSRVSYIQLYQMLASTPYIHIAWYQRTTVIKTLDDLAVFA